MNTPSEMYIGYVSFHLNSYAGVTTNYMRGL